MRRSDRLRSVVSLASLLSSALSLCVVALINGGPIYYPDTRAYLLDADRLLHFEAPYAVRPVFYGLAIWPFHWDRFFIAAVFIQGLIVAHVIYLTARTCGCGLNARGLLGLVVALVVLTPVSFHVSHLLPDIFVGVLILALFLLGFCRESLRRSEVWSLILLATAAISFHLSAIPVGLALFSLCLLSAIAKRGRQVAPLLVLAPILMGTLLSLTFSVAVFHRLTLTPKNPPHLLARLIADGPGRDYLRETCPGSGFILCDYQDRLTAVEDDFLWRLLPAIPAADGYRIKAEAQTVVEATIARFPVQVMDNMVRNTLRQLVTFQSQTQVSRHEWDEFQASDMAIARSLERSLQGRGVFESPALVAVNAFQAGVVLVSLLSGIVMSGMALGSRLLRPVALAAAVSTGLVANSFACGAFSGVFARYEGRVIWLLPLTALVCALALLRARTSVYGADGAVPTG